MAPDVADDFVKITPRHLRSADEMCRRRLGCELKDQRGNAPGGARFEVANRLGNDARLAHTEFGPPDPRAFVVPKDLLPEQQAVYRAVVQGYLALFGAIDARTVDTTFEHLVPDLEVRLVGDPGVVVDTDDVIEVRVLRIGDRGHARTLLDDVDLRCIALRAETFGATDHVRVVVAELLNLGTAEFDLDLGAQLDGAREWLAERVAAIRTLAADEVPRAGGDCLGCRFVNGCRAHKAW